MIILSCKKESDHAQWDVDALGPILNATITIDQLIADSITQETSDHAITILYERNLYNLNVDSIYQIPDTTIPTIVTWPLATGTIPPNSTFYSNNNDIVLGVTGVELTHAIIQSGNIRIQVRNTLPTIVTFTYTIPKALKNGIAFKVVRDVAAGSASSAGLFSGVFDFSGYAVDLTGSTGAQFNTVAYNVNAKSDPLGPTINVVSGDTLINLNATLLNISPSYAQGYLGQTNVKDSTENDFGLGKMIRGGTILLDSVKLNLDIENSIGADARIFLNSLTSINTWNNTNVDLVAPSLLNRPININRAQETGPAPAPVISTHSVFQLDNNNSNLKSFMENLPDRVSSDLSLDVNPLGNISGYHDFIYSDKLVNAKMQFEMPLRFAGANLTLLDTQDLSLGSLTNLEPIWAAIFTLVAINGFPFDIDLRLLLLDSNFIVTDSLFIPGLIAAAHVDASFKVIAPRETRIAVPVDAARKQRILDTRHAVLRAKLSTPSYPQLIQLYSYYNLDLRLIADGVYSIR